MSIVKNVPCTSKFDKSVFQGYNVEIGKTRWNIVTRTKNDNVKSVTVSKTYPNPFLTVGKEFDSFDEAVGNYKNPTMKMNLRLIEIGI